MAALAPGAAIPGTAWVKLDATRMKTKGGLVHEYGAGGRSRLATGRAIRTRVPPPRDTVAGALRVTAIEQCTSGSACSALFTLSYDANGRLAAISDRAGQRAEFTLERAGRLASARDALDVAKGWPGFRYDVRRALLASLTNSEGERTATSMRRPGSRPRRRRGRLARVSLPVRRPRGAGVYHTRHWIRSASNAATARTRSAGCSNGKTSPAAA